MAVTFVMPKAASVGLGIHCKMCGIIWRHSKARVQVHHTPDGFPANPPLNGVFFLHIRYGTEVKPGA